jgi:hypothetical protein
MSGRHAGKRLRFQHGGVVCEADNDHQAHDRKEGVEIMPYAILRFEKRRGGPASALEKHHERKKQQYVSNPDIDTERSEMNFYLVQPRVKYYGEIQNRIEKAQKENPKCKVRKDSVKFIDTIVTASPEFFDCRSAGETEKYFKHALEFLQEEVGADNIFSAVVHMDERNPHMHLCFVPLTKDKRLSAKEVMGDRNKLIEWQDKFHEHMSKEFSELERGESAAVTKRKHIPTWLYKQANRLTEQMEQMKREIEGIGTFNAQKKKENLLDMFCKWYPRINAFENQLKPYAQQLEILQHNEAALETKTRQAQRTAQIVQNENSSLIYQLRDYQGFVDSITEELKKELMEQYEQKQGEQTQGLKL